MAPLQGVLGVQVRRRPRRTTRALAARARGPPIIEEGTSGEAPVDSGEEWERPNHAACNLTTAATAGGQMDEQVPKQDTQEVPQSIGAASDREQLHPGGGKNMQTEGMANRATRLASSRGEKAMGRPDDHDHEATGTRPQAGRQQGRRYAPATGAASTKLEQSAAPSDQVEARPLQGHPSTLAAGGGDRQPEQMETAWGTSNGVEMSPGPNKEHPTTTKTRQEEGEGVSGKPNVQVALMPKLATTQIQWGNNKPVQPRAQGQPNLHDSNHTTRSPQGNKEVHAANSVGTTQDT